MTAKTPLDRHPFDPKLDGPFEEMAEVDAPKEKQRG